jgi:hypothetical protein
LPSTFIKPKEPLSIKKFLFLKDVGSETHGGEMAWLRF